VPRTAAERRGPGRPRDPELERKVLLATVDVFGERGWVGLSFEEIATRSQVGKSSITCVGSPRSPCSVTRCEEFSSRRPRRPWRSGGIRESQGSGEDVPFPEPSLRDYLVAHAMHRALLYLGPARSGLAATLCGDLRASRDLRRDPGEGSDQFRYSSSDTARRSHPERGGSRRQPPRYSSSTPSKAPSSCTSWSLPKHCGIACGRGFAATWSRWWTTAPRGWIHRGHLPSGAPSRGDLPTEWTADG